MFTAAGIRAIVLSLSASESVSRNDGKSNTVATTKPVSVIRFGKSVARKSSRWVSLSLVITRLNLLEIIVTAWFRSEKLEIAVEFGISNVEGDPP